MLGLHTLDHVQCKKQYVFQYKVGNEGVFLFHYILCSLQTIEYKYLKGVQNN